MPARIALFALLICVLGHGFAQHNVDFQAPASVCIGEPVSLTNDSDPGELTQWNFCSDQLDGAYNGVSLGSMGVYITGISVAEENGQWYGFITSEQSQLIRVNFGSSPSNASVTTTSLGNFGGLLPAPKGIDMVLENGIWYGLATAHTSEIIRLVWNNSLANPPVAQSLNLTGTGILKEPASIEIVKQGTKYAAVVANKQDNKVLVIDFGTSISNTPVSTDIKQSSSLPGAANTTGVSVSRQCDNWHVYAIATNKIYRFDLGTDIFSIATPVALTEFSTVVPFALNQFNKVKVIDYNGGDYIYITSQIGGYLGVIKWEAGASTPEYTDIGASHAPGNPFAIETYNDRGTYGLFVGGVNSTMLHHISIDAPCDADQHFSQSLEPEVRYSVAGTHTISLSTQFADGTICVATKQVNVTGDVAPIPVTSFEGVCVGSDVQFHAEAGNATPITSYSWDFGDSGAGLGQEVIHTYAAEDVYSARVDVAAGNGCTNYDVLTVKVFDAPTAVFQMPTGLVCTNNEFLFDNQTQDDFDGNLSFQWFINDEAAGSSRDLVHAFGQTGDFEIKLVATIPGCSDESIHTLTGVESGPSAEVETEGECEGVPVQFSSTVEGQIVSVYWDFGNGQFATTTDAENTFDNGLHQVLFRVEGTNGCLTEIVTPLIVYEKPEANFALDLPPFSCAGSPSQFHDVTPTPSGSNLEAFAWTFGDGTSGTGKNPSHTYSNAGSYTVGLTVTTDHGCIGVKSAPVNISASPTASFTHSVACVSGQTTFQGLTSGTAKSWLWKVGSATYNVQNPIHVFGTPGTVSAQLTVTGTNNCVTTVSEVVNIPVVPVLDFTVSNACTGQPTTLQASATGASDPVTSYKWNFGGDLTLIGQTATRIFGAGGVQSVGMSTVHQSGCTYAITKSVMINSTPIAGFSPIEQYGAAPLGVTFSNSSTGATTYLWQFDDGSTSTSASPNHVFNELGVYEISMQATSDAGCSANASGTVHVIVPHTDLSVSELDFLPEAGSNSVKGVVTIANQSNYPITAFDLMLETGSGVLITEHVSQKLPPQSEFTLLTQSSLTFAGSEGHVCVSVVVAGDEDVENDRQCQSTGQESVVFEPYPNPSRGTLTIQFVAQTADQLDIRLVNETGADAYSTKVAVVPGLNLFTLDISNLGPGLYVVRAASTTSLITRRVVISN